MFWLALVGTVTLGLIAGTVVGVFCHHMYRAISMYMGAQ
jgi:hypothetical protein